MESPYPTLGNHITEPLFPMSVTLTDVNNRTVGLLRLHTDGRITGTLSEITAFLDGVPVSSDSINMLLLWLLAAELRRQSSVDKPAP